MKIGFICGNDFVKTDAFYISKILAGQLTKTGNEVFIFNKTQQVLNIQNTNEFIVKGLIQNQKLSNLINKNGIEKLVVFDVDDLTKTSLPQFIIINKEHSADESVLKKLERSTGIISFSKKYSEKLSNLNPGLKQKIIFAQPIIQAGFGPLNTEERSAVKQEFTEGKEFFICADSHIDKDSFLNLLKAFSEFKKMQQTNWKLVVAFRSMLTTIEKEETLQPLSNFKYRDDVCIINEPADEVLHKLIGAAYVLLSVNIKSQYNLPVMEALVCHTPVIALHSIINIFYPEPILEPANTGPSAIAEKMMFLYKNESLRSRLSQKAAQAVKDFDAAKNLDELVTLIE